MRERAHQAAALHRFVRERRTRGALRVVLGDFNEWYRGPVARTLERELGGGGGRFPTHPAPLPMFPVDRIYWDRERAGRMQVLREGPVRIASDHLPLVAELDDG